MSINESARAKVVKIITDGGYYALEDEFAIGRVELKDVTAFNSADDFLDLILLIEVDSSAGSPQAAIWTAQRVARALDISESRRQITAIILHEAGTRTSDLSEQILRVARVVLVDVDMALRRQLSPILPLVFDEALMEEQDALGALAPFVRSSRDREQFSALISAATESADGVHKSLKSWLTQSLEEMS